MGSTKAQQDARQNTPPKVQRDVSRARPRKKPTPPERPSVPGMENDWIATPKFRIPINPDTGRPWTEEERGPVVRTPKEAGEDYPSRGHYEGDNLFRTETLEYVPERDLPGGPISRLLERKSGGSVKKTRVF